MVEQQSTGNEQTTNHKGKPQALPATSHPRTRAHIHIHTQWARRRCQSWQRLGGPTTGSFLTYPLGWRGGGGCNFGCDDCEKFLDAVRSTLQVIGNGLAWLLHRYPGLCGFGGSPV